MKLQLNHYHHYRSDEPEATGTHARMRVMTYCTGIKCVHRFERIEADNYKAQVLSAVKPKGPIPPRLLFLYS